MSNESLIEKKCGKEVRFGDEIQLYHARSCSCLFVDSKCKKNEKASYKIGLSPLPKKEAYFCIKPKLKLHQDGDFIQYKDQLLLFNFKMKGYLEISKEILSDSIGELIKGKQAFYKSLHPDIKFRENSATFCKKSAVLTSESSGFIWMPIECKANVENSRTVRGNDFIYLQHTETDSYITADVQQGEFTNLYLRRYIGTNELELTTVQGIWQIQRLNPSSAKRSGVLKCGCKSLILRNYFTGEVVTVDRNGTLHCLPHDPRSKETMANLKFIPMSKKTMKHLRNGESFCISNSANGLTFTSSSRLERGFTNGRPETDMVDDHLNFLLLISSE
jgi:Inositol 1,4,5-trisphosphate/ryanodine receptor